MWYCSSLFSFFFFVNILLPDVTSKQIPLIGLFTSETFENNSNRSSTIMIDYALDHLKTIQNLTSELFIQNHDRYLPCDMAVGTKAVFDMIHRQPRPLAIFSGSCQIVASAIAETAGIFDMTIVKKRFELDDFSILSLFSKGYLFRDKFIVYSSRKVSVIDSNRSG